MDDTKVTAYLERIGVPRPAVLDAATLRELHRAHQATVPFENLSIHRGEVIRLSAADLLDKLVTRRRGGFCYELNGAFALLLTALGARVTRVAARVYDDGRLGPPFDHLALLVDLDDHSGRWLVDVGFGAHSTYPLRFADRRAQDDPGGRFELVDAADGDVEVHKDGQPQYVLERRARELTDFVPTCWWQQTSPESHFTRNTICSRLTDDGRVTIRGSSLIRTTDGTRTEKDLPSDAALRAAYRDEFRIVLD